ncbi:MAG: M1 family aminopeptidase [Sediminibacterium sp.]|nr:HEAT repeat domain-containing protein [Chitinophagaceae bacterium]MCA6446596.1 HEAT repeat domain-containing protein [Chitinophagaceae bacterium]
MSFLLTTIKAQTTTNSYHETPVKVNDLVHTKLDIRFDYQKKYLYGKEWVTLKPHFYSTDSLRLNAKGMDIHNVSIFKNDKLIPLKFSYDNFYLAILLDTIYTCNQTYIIYIDYTAKPTELKNRKKNEKGLYFINADGKDTNKPTEIWTEGEPESSSVWFPTIDKPNQKTTEEISMTVPNKYVTLSNGKLISQKENTDGTRTDSWKMDLPHSPYLFMMAVGDFKIYKDNWRGKEVSYYLEPKYAPFAKEIFGETPEAIDFFSNILGINYPWNKYSQIVVRDYVSGAMENTTATMMGEPAQATTKELADRYYNTGIVHELFHQWFGDYVTCESWSNLTLNESLAVYGEYLWLENKYGKDVADAHNFEGLQAYLDNKNAKNEPLVRFQYKEIQDVFDGVTYQKGGCILNMLRNYLGKHAFYKGLNIYLKNNAFKNAETPQLRMAFEEASGLDLNWFFNQWYFGAGHPELNISYNWNENTNTQTIYLQQTQEGNAFVLPIAIDFYNGNKIERRKTWMTDKADTLSYKLTRKPNLVNVDADKVLITKKTDNKPLAEFSFQYFNAPLFLDRYEAIEAAIGKQNENDGQKIILAALKDKYFGLRIKAINALDITNAAIANSTIPIVRELATSDKNNMVRATAITFLSKLRKNDDLSLFENSLKTESYAVQGASLAAIGLIDSSAALRFAKQYENDSKHEISQAILTLYSTYGGNEQWNYIYNLFLSLVPPQRFNMIESFASLTGRVENPAFAKQGITAIKELGIQGKQFGISDKIIELLKEIKKRKVALNDDSSALSVDEAIAQINDTK